MKFAIRVLLFLLLVGSLPNAALAETRAKALKRAEREIRNGNFDEAEKTYRHLVEHNQEDNVARLGLSFVLIKKIRLVEAYEEAARVIVADPLNGRAFSLL